MSRFGNSLRNHRATTTRPEMGPRVRERHALKRTTTNCGRIQVGLPLQTMFTALAADSCDIGGRYQLHGVLQSVFTSLMAQVSLLGSSSRVRVCVYASARVRVHQSHSNSTLVAAAPPSMHICCRFSFTAPMMNLYVRPPSCSFQAGSLHNCFMSHLDLSINCNHKHRPALRASFQRRELGKQSLG